MSFQDILKLGSLPLTCHAVGSLLREALGEEKNEPAEGNLEPEPRRIHTRSVKL